MAIFSLSRVGTAIAASICLLGISTGASAMPVTIDFESLPTGNAGASYTESGVTFTPVAPSTSLEVFDLTNSGRSIIAAGTPFQPVRADIVGGASMVSILIGDNNGDTDSMFLTAFNALNVQIAQDTLDINLGFGTLTVNIPDIAYVVFGATGGTNGSSVVTDEFTFTAGTVQVSEPGMLAILGLGLAGLGFARRKRTA